MTVVFRRDKYQRRIQHSTHVCSIQYIYIYIYGRVSLGPVCKVVLKGHKPRRENNLGFLANVNRTCCYMSVHLYSFWFKKLLVIDTKWINRVEPPRPWCRGSSRGGEDQLDSSDQQRISIVFLTNWIQYSFASAPLLLLGATGAPRQTAGGK